MTLSPLVSSDCAELSLSAALAAAQGPNSARAMPIRPVQNQRVAHDSSMPLDIDPEDIPAEAARLEKLCATVDQRLERWLVMRAPSGQRFCVVRVQPAGFQKDAKTWA